MATLKEHQAAMVDLLANGSGIPASASRLAHAMHDVLSAILSEPDLITKAIVESKAIRDAYTSPGLNDKALSKREKALKTDSPAKWPTPAEQRDKELENTIRQLKEQRAKDKATIAEQKALLAGYSLIAFPKQAGCCKPDTQACVHEWNNEYSPSYSTFCLKCGAKR